MEILIGFEDVQDFISDISSARNADEIQAAFSKKTAPLGFDKHTCLSVVDWTNPPPESLLLFAFPQKWVDYYTEQRYFEHDVVLQRVFTTSKPYIWSDLSLPDKINQQIFSEASEFGILNGMTIPITVPGQPPCTVNIAGENLDVPPRVYHILHIMAVHYHDAVLTLKLKDLNADTPVPKLTARERECLHWAAAGKSDQDIGDILYISARTSHFHIENAKRKLGVSTRQQAIARAVLNGIIRP
ncbi:helix-turn-helix transcriptional regulator [Luteithermobacter gelatinilyticus]|uniref:helix-turn-helix transcriptional regulator n=1 Tax=Luteithermobacter gelatinilyticus TaxID=2582913 RepID=UPI001106BC1D|nr:LuxR family transcriptional regulator [Luteithermobacter gelatinilyticus]